MPPLKSLEGIISSGGSLFSCRLVPFSPAEVVPFSVAVSTSERPNDSDRANKNPTNTGHRAADDRPVVGVRLPLADSPPDHSTLSRTRRLIDVETHDAVFGWLLKVLSEEGLIDGQTVGVDGTLLEANAALRSIVRKDSGESYSEFLTELAKASGIETPTRADLARIDRKRPKKGSNDDWEHPGDPTAQIMKMKDGSTHLAHKAEHVVDMSEDG